MNLHEFQIIFEQECRNNKINYDKNKSELLFQYMNLILDWNTQINVTAIREEKEFIVKHFIDSLTVDYLLEGKIRMLDIGTGAGFPGIPLKIYHPEIQVSLIDSVNKKITVLKDVIEKLGLNDIEALHIRAEDLAKNTNYREKFDVVTTRAVSNLATIAEYMLPFVRLGGIAICMKGPNLEEELENSKKAIKVLGGEIDKIDKFVVDGEYERNIVIIRKIKETEHKYPRGQGKPLKNPIK